METPGSRTGGQHGNRRQALAMCLILLLYSRVSRHNLGLDLCRAIGFSSF
jgi:hypothetical protein